MSDGRWRRVYSLNWLQGAVQGLDDAERVTWLYCLTGPQSTSVGIYRLSTAVAIEDLGNVTAEQFEQRFENVCRAMDWQFDPQVRVLWIPSWLEENPPQSPNVVVSWRKLLGNVPDCAVKADAVNAIHRYLKDMPEAFSKAFGSLRVSLPKDTREAKSSPKALPKANQVSGIRDQGIQGEREQPALRAGALKKTNGESSLVVNNKLLAIAREAKKMSSDPENAIDAFLYLCRESSIDATRAVALTALAEIRTA